MGAHTHLGWGHIHILGWGHIHIWGGGTYTFGVGAHTHLGWGTYTFGVGIHIHLGWEHTHIWGGGTYTFGVGAHTHLEWRYSHIRNGVTHWTKVRIRFGSEIIWGGRLVYGIMQGIVGASPCHVKVLPGIT